MGFGGPGFVLTIIAICMASWVITSWIRAKHGYPLEGDWGQKIEKTRDVENEQLREENLQLTDRLENSEDRLAVLEKIITDKSYRVGQEIEALRDEK